MGTFVIEIEDNISLPPRGIEGGKARAAKLPQTAAKPKVRIAYRAWMRREGIAYRNSFDFAVSMSVEHPEIKDASTVQKWIRREWKEERATDVR